MLLPGFPLQVPNFLMATPIAIIGAASSALQALGATSQGVQASFQIKDRWSANVKDVDDRAPECVIKRNGPDIRDFGTLRKALGKILDWLMNGYDVKGIGIHGIPGIGKTTIMSNLNDHNQVAKMFDVVIWLKVSKEGKENLCRENLQQDIVQRLKLKRGGTRNPDEVAQRISMVLERKRYLLLLDDVKQPLNLREIGIPNSNNGSKIVLTTRERPVCKWMNLDKEIKVEYLPIDEAWKMFQNVIGKNVLTEDPKILPIAHKVCEECCGLPLLIEKVAPTFKFKTTAIRWEGVLDDWRMWPVEGLGGIEELYERMRFCYNELKDERFQKCFLYGALYPEDRDINTDSLLECWEAEDLLVHGNDGRTERVKAGYSAIDHLQDVSFFEKGKRDYHVTMEKFIRQVAFYISEGLRECKHLVKTNKKLSDPPDVESWSEKNRISLGANELYRLPDSPNCSMLSTLFLQSNKVLKEIPSEFFNCMIELRVLDLSDTGITSLPSSLSILCKLKVLHLNNCKQLVELPSNIEGLEDLEFLDIHGSGINGIPSHIKKLKLLKHLWVSFGNGNGNGAQGVSFNYNMISELSELEELVIDFEKRQQCTNAVVQNIMEEVAKLEKFKKLRVCFPEMIIDVLDIGIVPPKTVLINVPEARALLSYIEGSSWKEVRKITSFQFFIGLELKKGEYCRHRNLAKYGKYVKYCNGVVSDKDDTPILEVLAEAEGLELVSHTDMTQLSDFVTSNMNKIKGFVIDGCAAMETIIDTGGSELLPNLDVLIINNLRRLKSIWKVTLRSGCQASKLTTLVISNCKVLVNVCPPGAIQQLSVIQYLTIEKCDKVEEIFPRVNGLILPNLKELILLGMKKLSSICAIESLILPSLEKLKILKCPSLRKLPFNRGNVMNLNCIEAEKNWWEALLWQEQEDKEELEKLYVPLEVMFCP
ncbi:hypothetical protein Vadar_002436 [Vaccinium darrowii]|uniref:Uncharacterized protein n=1 Tax=Vaccinium darrowii TaxID=229202 RepID=A0ACB7YS72_9ERIC|nr:hypothetical protein Vadar_002436 [Vaccinium darrowii]